MKRAERRIAFLLTVLLLLSGCGNTNKTEEKAEELHVLAAFYPIYALTSMIAEDIPDLYLSYLVQPQDGCLRDYSLSDWDLSLILGSDAVITAGCGLESFASVLTSLGEDGPAVATLLNESELERFECANTAPESHWASLNPFTYMSIDGAIRLVTAAEGCLSALDPKYAPEYHLNLESAKRKLEELRAEIHEIAGNLNGRRVAVMNEALAYTAREFELDPAVFWARESGEGLSESELNACAEALRAENIRVILIEQQAPERLTAALNAAGFIVAELDTMSTGSAQTGAEGYFDAQRRNAQALRDAFAEAEG